MQAIASQCQYPAVSGNVNAFLMLKQSQHCAFLFQISQGDARKRTASDVFKGAALFIPSFYLLGVVSNEEYSNNKSNKYERDKG